METLPTLLGEPLRICFYSSVLTLSVFSLPQIKERNFDTTARKVKKKRDVVDDEDTIEKQIAGLADMIIADDEAKRHEDLVRIFFGVCDWNGTDELVGAGPVEYRA